jgi:hypothetical protein
LFPTKSIRIWRHYDVMRVICFLYFVRRTACTEFFSWFQWIQTVFKINTIIYRNKLFTDEFHNFKWIITCTEIEQNRYVFDVIMTSCALFVFGISWNFARDISTVFEEIKHLRIDRPLNLPQYPGSNNYFSIPEENI